MLHKERCFQVTEIDQFDDLVDRLDRYSHTPCTAFRHDGVLFLNDATGPDGAQEYAVVDADEETQIESITVSWMDEDRLREVLGKVYEYASGDDPTNSRVDIELNDLDERTEPADEHGRCRHCR